MGLVAQWLEETVGGLEAMHRINQEKARLVYAAMDRHPKMYIGHARAEDRSLMNATYKLPNDSLENAFLAEAKTLGLDSLKGHRSVGGIRASIYNAMPLEGVQTLVQLMDSFASKHA